MEMGEGSKHLKKKTMWLREKRWIRDKGKESPELEFLKSLWGLGTKEE